MRTMQNMRSGVNQGAQKIDAYRRVPHSPVARVETISFRNRNGYDLGLDGTLLGNDGEVAADLSEHQVLYQSGRLHQRQGQGGRKFTYRCLFQEPGAKERIRAIEAALAIEPFGDLTDPRFGRLDAVWMSLRYSEEVDRSTNTLEVDFSFSETTLRQTTGTTPTSSAAAAVQSAATARAISAPIPAFVIPSKALVDAVDAFQIAAGQALLDVVGLQVALAQVQYAVQNMLALVGVQVAYALLAAQVRLALGQCVVAYNQAGASTAQIIPIPVDETISFTRWAAQTYGGGASAVEDQIYLLNRIPDPLMMPSGFILGPDPAQVSQVLLAR